MGRVGVGLDLWLILGLVDTGCVIRELFEHSLETWRVWCIVWSLSVVKLSYCDSGINVIYWTDQLVCLSCSCMVRIGWIDVLWGVANPTSHNILLLFTPIFFNMRSTTFCICTAMVLREKKHIASRGCSSYLRVILYSSCACFQSSCHNCDITTINNIGTTFSYIPMPWNNEMMIWHL